MKNNIFDIQKIRCIYNTPDTTASQYKRGSIGTQIYTYNKTSLFNIYREYVILLRFIKAAIQ